MGSSRERGFSVTPERLAFIEQKMREMGIDSREALAEATTLSPDVIQKKLFSGKNVDRSTVEAIAKALKIQATELVEPDRWYRRSKTAKSQAFTNIDWHYVCRTMLDRQKKLSTNEVIASEAMQFDLLDDEIFISLALVERKEPERLSQNVHPAQPIEQYEEKPPIEYEQFREQVLRQGKSDRIAIVGEPGAGKTTLLQHIAFWILDKELGLPIWISLGDLIKNGDLQRLKDYLTQVWLDDAVLNVTQDVKSDFLKQLNEQRVWLLLDGADEIVASSGIALREINNQLRGWLSQSSIILTCRINVWEVDINALRDFQTYRTKEFHYPTQVEQFIKSGFRKSNQQSGECLKTELANTERTRLQQLVRNPLRLMMLCTTWHEQQSLPPTKAELYKRFVSEFYKWNGSKWKKKDLNYAFFPNTEAQQEKLNKALGRLACRALDEESSPFRLPHNLVSEELGDPDEGGSDFWLALNLGWLQVARDSDKPSDKVYTFFHPTFQEYLAALAIDRWKFFLDHNSQNPSEGSYRIFESLWKESFLLWLGRLDVDTDPKEELIFSLKEFKDGCNNFYKYQAFFLVGESLSEFKSIHTDDLLERLVNMACNRTFESIDLWVRAEEIICKTDKNLVGKKILQFIEKTHYIDIRAYAIEILEKVDSNNPQIKILLEADSQLSFNYSIAFPSLLRYNNSSV
jgi:predicted NACHT family NTPase